MMLLSLRKTEAPFVSFFFFVFLCTMGTDVHVPVSLMYAMQHLVQMIVEVSARSDN